LDVTYSPTLTRGTTSFTYTIEDINGEQDTATVTVTVTNRPPNQCNQQVSVESGVIFQDIVVANCGIEPPDPEGDDVHIVSFTQPANGTVTQLDTVVFQYQSNPGYTGGDSFVFTVQDSFGALAPSATVTIDVTPFANDPPDAPDITRSTRAGPTAGLEVAIDVPLLVVDPDGPTLDVQVPVAPSNGSIIVSPSGLIRYTPNAGFSGADVFDYTVDDGAGGTDTATITINVAADLPPIAADDSASTAVWPGEVQIDVKSNDLDPEGDSMAYADLVIVAQPQNGTLNFGCAGSCSAPTYVPNKNFSGTDTFTYRAVDELGAASNIATVTITVGTGPTPPVAADDVATTSKDLALTINPLANDSPDATTIATVTQPNQGGTTSIVANQIQYTPPSGFRGTETFQYEAQNASGLRDAATVTVTIANRAPVANDDPASTTAGLAVQIPVLGNDIDLDGDVKTITSFTQGANGVVTQGADLEYTPTGSFTGSDSFTYTIDDGFGGVDTGTVTVNVVAGSNAPPTAVIAGGNRSIADSDTQPGELVDFDGSASFDADGVITCGSWTVNGVVQDIACTTTPQFALNDGVNTVTLVVTDDGNPPADSAPTTVTITVTAPGANQPPVAVIAGGNRSVNNTDGIAGETVSFDGSASSDADGSIASYQWSINGQTVAAACRRDAAAASQ
jgi:hypothetical protein